jgi:hypothetical protein
VAQKTVVELLDDIDGRPAHETVSFSLDGVSYEIDLSSQNADALRRRLRPFIEQARHLRGGGARRARRAGSGTRPTSNRERSAEIRAWAKRHGIQVNERGRISAQVVDAYEANDPSRAKSATSAPQVAFQPAE